MAFLASIGIALACCILYYVYRFWKIQSDFQEYGVRCLGLWAHVRSAIEMIVFGKNQFHELKKVYQFDPESKYKLAFDFPRPVIMICDLDLIKSVAIKNWESFVDRRVDIDETVEPLIGKTLFALRGQHWRHQRALLTAAFTSHKLRLMFALMSNCASNFVNSIVEMSSSGGKEFEMKELSTKYGIDLIASCAFGLEIDSMRDPGNEFYARGMEISKFMGIRVLKFLLLRFAPWLGRVFNVKMFDADFTNYFTNTIASVIKSRDEGKISRPDMLQLMMDTRGTADELDLTSMTAHAFIFFFAGFDPVTTQISFLAHEIAVNPEVQRKLHEEIDAEWNRSKGNLTYDSVKDMVYLDAAVMECLRRYPVSFLTDRICTKDFELPPTKSGAKPYTCKSGDAIYIPISAILHDEKYFPEPEKFIPERFLGKKTLLNQAPNIPFGIGPRSCIGNRFALMEIKTVIFHLLLHCDLKVCAKSNVPMVFAKNTRFFLKSEGGWWLKIEPRSSSPFINR